jgi:hypothetical protein
LLLIFIKIFEQKEVLFMKMKKKSFKLYSVSIYHVGFTRFQGVPLAATAEKPRKIIGFTPRI